jgi:hypothetical protein
MNKDNGWGTNPAMPRPSEGPSASWGPYFLCHPETEDAVSLAATYAAKTLPRSDG